MPNGYTQTGVNESTGQRDWSKWSSPFTGTGLPAPPGGTYGPGVEIPGAGYGPGADDAAAMYRNLFGTTTPQARATQGLPPTGDVTLPAGAMPDVNRYANGGGANNAPSTPAATPQQAGQNNSDYPGWSNGNQEVGVAKSETGQSDTPPLASRTATDPLNVALTTADAGMPPPPQGEQKSAQATGSEQAPGGTTQTVIKPPANNWGLNIEGHGPSTPFSLVDAQGNPLKFASGGVQDAERVQAALVGHPYVQKVVQALGRLVYGGAGQPSLVAGSTGNPHYSGMLNKATEIEAYLNSLGIDWHPVQTFVQGMNGGGGSGNGGGTGGGGDGGTGGTGGDTGGGSTPPVANTTDYMTQAEAIVNHAIGGGMNDPKYKPFLVAMQYAIAQQLQAQADKGTGVGIYSGAIDDVKNDPRRAAEGSIIDSILARPNNTPEDAVRSQLIAGAKSSAAGAASQYGRNATRRLGSAGAAAAPGVTSEMYRRADNELQNTIAQNEIARAERERQGQDRALSLSQGYRASTVDQDAERARALAAMVMGRPDVGPNPMSDAANAWTGSNYFNKAMNQSTGSSFGWQDALSTLTGLIGGTSTGMGAGGAGASGLGAILPMLGI